MGPNTCPVPNVSSLMTEMSELPTVPWACLCRIGHNCISRDLKYARSLRVLRQRQLIVGKIELQYGLMVPTGRVLKLNWTPASSLWTSPAQERHPRIAILTPSQTQKFACSMFYCNYGDFFYILREKIFHACNISLCRNVLILTLPV